VPILVVLKIQLGAQFQRLPGLRRRPAWQPPAVPSRIAGVLARRERGPGLRCGGGGKYLLPLQDNL